ncbi:hypothetical protein JTB14_024718 [Gonioctena quinquepunctata]|nr:hypothetical protein JTB14_024718 [Gonioctena quinquepunctata]
MENNLEVSDVSTQPSVSEKRKRTPISNYRPDDSIESDESQSDQSIRRKGKKNKPVWVKGRKRNPLTPEAQTFPLDSQPEPELAMPNDQLEK